MVRQRVGVKPAVLSEDRLLAVIVVDCSHQKSALGDGQPRQCPSAFLDVGLGVRAHAEREKLHQFASEVLIGFSLAIGRGVEPR